MIMNSEIITSFLIASVAILPGICALINQIKKDKTNKRVIETSYTNARMGKYVDGLQDRVLRLDKDMIQEQRNTVVCGYCGSYNYITNFNCTQCGAPAGRFMEAK